MFTFFHVQSTITESNIQIRHLKYRKIDQKKKIK